MWEGGRVFTAKLLGTTCTSTPIPYACEIVCCDLSISTALTVLLIGSTGGDCCPRGTWESHPQVDACLLRLHKASEEFLSVVVSGLGR